MKKMKISIFFAAFILLTGCAAISQNGDENNVSSKEDDFLSTELETLEESASDTEDEQQIVLNVLHQEMEAEGIYNGVRNIILQQELNLKIRFLPADTDVENAFENEALDIIVWFSPSQFKNDLDKGYILTWDEEFLENYGTNILKYAHDEMERVSELNNGTACGFMEKNIYADAWGCIYSIASNSNHQEEAMKLLNWLCSPETYMLMCYGPQGVGWDVDDQGYFYATELGAQYFCIGKGVFPEEYGGEQDRFNDLMIPPGIFFPDDINPVSEHGETFNWETWERMKEDAETIKSKFLSD